jgi:hypothetical protein
LWLGIEPIEAEAEADSTVREVVVFNMLSKGWPFDKRKPAILSQRKPGIARSV